MYTLGEEDWRFLLQQYVCGVFYNKTEDNTKITGCLVDKHESAPANLVVAILINAKIDSDTIFGSQVDPDTMIDIDVIIQSLAKGLRNILKNQRILMEVVFPQVLILAYQRLLSDIEVIEAVSFESERLERMIYQYNVKKIHDPEVHQQILFFTEIV